MYNRELNGRLGLFLIIVLAISLTSLGMRFPSANGISSSGKPRPRPRAIIKNQIKTCKQIIKQIPTAVVTGYSPPAYCPLIALPLQSSSCPCHTPADTGKTLSRAPPQLS